MNSRFLPFAFVGTLAVIFVAVGSVWYFAANKNPQQNPPASGGVACTQEAKECPDGSYVGRTGPHCEFAACPIVETSTPAQTEGSVTGVVLLGPTCPVERIPPDPACAPKPYQTSIVISKNIKAPEPFLTIRSAASGTFTVSLPAGEYVFHPQGGSLFPRCDEQLVTVGAGSATTTTINCDTGIR